MAFTLQMLINPGHQKLSLLVNSSVSLDLNNLPPRKARSFILCSDSQLPISLMEYFTHI